jgi:hypothetical protein
MECFGEFLAADDQSLTLSSDGAKLASVGMGNVLSQ